MQKDIRIMILEIGRKLMSSEEIRDVNIDVGLKDGSNVKYNSFKDPEFEEENPFFGGDDDDDE